MSDHADIHKPLTFHWSEDDLVVSEAIRKWVEGMDCTVDPALRLEAATDPVCKLEAGMTFRVYFMTRGQDGLRERGYEGNPVVADGVKDLLELLADTVGPEIVGVRVLPEYGSDDHPC